MATTQQADGTALVERRKCAASPVFFVWNYIQIKSGGDHVPFRMWADQVDVLRGLTANKLVILLKSRQIGMTTLVLAYALWLTIFKPNTTVLLFSKGLKESKDLIDRLRDTFERVPAWLRRHGIDTDNAAELRFTNGSRFVSFASSTSGGDSYTADLVIIDEADLIRNLNTVMAGAKPTIDHPRGQMVLLSKASKTSSESPFKQIYRGAARGANGYWSKFLPWWSKPDRDQAYYDANKAEILSRTGALDELFSNYPATPEEALAAAQLGKRIPAEWLEQCVPDLDEHGLRRWPEPIASPVLAGVRGLRVYAEPAAGHTYVIGVDLASGRGESPQLDDSALVIFDEQTRRQVAAYNARVEPSIMGQYVAVLSRYYQMAGVLVEQNGQWGGACLEYLKLECRDVKLLRGPAKKGLGDVGFNTTTNSKIDLYQRLADGARDQKYEITDRQTYEQLSSIEGRTLMAPVTMHDDLAMAFAIGYWALESPGPEPFIEIARQEPPVPYDKPKDTSWERLGALGIPKRQR